MGTGADPLAGAPTTLLYENENNEEIVHPSSTLKKNSKTEEIAGKSTISLSSMLFRGKQKKESASEIQEEQEYIDDEAPRKEMASFVYSADLENVESS